jgi:hypothetical protein
MKYSYVGISCPKKHYIHCLTNIRKFEFVKKQYLHELMQTLK